MEKGKAPKQRKKAVLLGVGLDNTDGHTRITQGNNFALFGGSESTHAEMQEKAIKMNEHLKQRGKTLDTVSTNEFIDIAHKLKMPVAIPRDRKSLSAPDDHDE